MLRVVHLSDFHFSEASEVDFELHCLNPLIKDLQSINEIKAIDLIVFSGDLIDRGGINFKEGIKSAFEAFEQKVINPIITALEMEKNKFIFVPGNHDIDRRADKERIDNALYNDLQSIEKINEFIDANDLSDGASRIIPYKEFEKKYYMGTDHEITNFASTFKYSIAGVKIGVTGFNSSWRCYDSDKDKGKILLGERQVALATQRLEECDLKIAVIHHPLDWFSSVERKQITSMIYRNYNMMFCGHVHESESFYTTSMFNDGLFISTAPANWSGNVRNKDRDFFNGYVYVDYNLSEAIVYNRRYDHLKGTYDPNNFFGDHEGKARYVFPTPNALKNIQKKMKQSIIFMQNIFL